MILFCIFFICVVVMSKSLRNLEIQQHSFFLLHDEVSNYIWDRLLYAYITDCKFRYKMWYKMSYKTKKRQTKSRKRRISRVLRLEEPGTTELFNPGCLKEMPLSNDVYFFRYSLVCPQQIIVSTRPQYFFET